MPEMPFYSKLMNRMKGRFIVLSFAACRKNFFDTLDGAACFQAAPLMFQEPV
jgi:hypothetical protein